MHPFADAQNLIPEPEVKIFFSPAYVYLSSFLRLYGNRRYLYRDIEKITRWRRELGALLPSQSQAIGTLIKCLRTSPSLLASTI